MTLLKQVLRKLIEKNYINNHANSGSQSLFALPIYIKKTNSFSQMALDKSLNLESLKKPN